jgi:hypothetical protein
MKLFFLSTVLVATVAGWLGLTSSDEKAPTACATDCRATMECTPQGTCLVTCYDESGEVLCRKEIPCPTDCSESTSCSR